MRLKNWVDKNTDAIVGGSMLLVFFLIPTVFILNGIYAEVPLLKGIWLFAGAGTAIPLVVIVVSVFKSKNKVRGGKEWWKPY